MLKTISKILCIKVFAFEKKILASFAWDELHCTAETYLGPWKTLMLELFEDLQCALEHDRNCHKYYTPVIYGYFFHRCHVIWHNCSYPIDTGRKLNLHKTFRRRPGRLLNVLYTFSLRPVSTGYCRVFEIMSYCTFLFFLQQVVVTRMLMSKWLDFYKM